MKILNRIKLLHILIFNLFLTTVSLGANAPISIYRYANSYDTSGWVSGTGSFDKNYRGSEQWIPGTNGFLCYKNIDFGSDSYTRFEILAKGQAIFELRLDKINNPAIATIKVGTSTYAQLDTLTLLFATIAPITGIHDVYLVGKEEPQATYALSFTFYGTTTISSPRIFYVSPKGSDADSGTLIKPFRTISRAASIMTAGDVCSIRTGIYGEILRPRNSGTASQPMRFEAYNNERVVITGADPITGWEKWKDNIYRAPMNWNMGPGYNQLYADTEQIYEARFPNINTPKSVMSEAGCINYDSTTGISNWCWWTFPHPWLPRGLSLPVCFGFLKGTDAPMCQGGMGLEWCESAWINFDATQSKGAMLGKGTNAFKDAVLWKEGYFTAETGIVTGSNDVTGGPRLDLRIGYWYGSESRGFVSGVLALLDTENEWALKDGYAYVWMPQGKDPSSVYMSAKRRTVTVDLSARDGIYLKGIYSLGGVLKMNESRNCIVDNCHFKYISHFTYFYNGSAPKYTYDTLWKSMSDGVVVSGNDNKILRSTIAFAADAPILLMGLRNVVDDCSIHDFGYTRSRSADILGEQCAILHSSIYNAGRACIAIGSGYTWGNNKLMYCDLYNGGLFAADGGTYYTYGQSGAYSEIAYNWFRDNQTSGPTGYLYFDGGAAEGIQIHHNVFFPHKRMGSFTSTTFSLPTHPTKLYHNTIAMQSTDGMDYWYPKWDSCSGIICSANNLDIYNTPLSKWSFVDTVRDFHLKSGSVAINAGKVVDAATFPGITTPVGKPDLGAYEYGGTDWRPGHTWGNKEWPSLNAISSESATGISTSSIKNTVQKNQIVMSKNSVVFLSNNSQNMNMRVFDPQGRSIAFVSGIGTRLFIPLRDVAGGFYIIKAQSGGNHIVKKFLLTQR